jgi:hypothetical protein
MFRITVIAITIIMLTSCGNDSYTCTCKDGEKEIATYKIETGKKESASFECKQKSLALSGNPQYKNVQCTVE